MPASAERIAEQGSPTAEEAICAQEPWRAPGSIVLAATDRAVKAAPHGRACGPALTALVRAGNGAVIQRAPRNAQPQRDRTHRPHHP
jgi:hypothetical protein